MSVYAVLEPVVLASALGVSAWVLAGRVAPRARAGVQAAIAGRLAGSAHPLWMQRLAARMSPTVASACGDGCSSCGSCGPSGSPSATAVKSGDEPGQKVVWLHRE